MTWERLEHEIIFVVFKGFKKKRQWVHMTPW